MDRSFAASRVTNALDDDEQTIERAPQFPGREAPPQAPTRPTLRVPYVDERLLAIARGEMDPDEAPFPDDPFGGLIPVDDDAFDELLDLLPDDQPR